jgi:hypothetical protein
MSEESPGTAPVTPSVSRDSQLWSSNRQVQRLLVVSMFACVAWAFGEMTVSMGLGLPSAISTSLLAFLVFTAGVSLGGRDTGKNYRRYTEYSLMDWVLLLVPIVLLLKLLPIFLASPGALGAEVASWVDEPWRFWDVGLVWSLLLIFFVWDFSVRVAEEIDRLSFQPRDNSTESWSRSPYRFVSHTKAWQRLMWSFVTGGFFILVFAGLALVSPEELGDAGRSEVSGIIPSVLLYYVLGLVLASQTSLDRLRTDWLRSGATVQTGLARRWLTYGVVLMICALVLALLLPTSFNSRAADELPGAWGLLSAITWPLRVILGAVFGVIGWLFAGLAALLFAPVAGLLPQGAGSAAPAVAPSVLPQATPTAAGADAPSIGRQLIWGFLFYVLPTLLAGYAIWNTWQKRRAIWLGLRDFSRDTATMIWGAILDMVAVLWRFFGSASPGFLARAPAAIKARWNKRGRRAGGVVDAPNWLRLRNLTPRALIVYFYTSLVQRATAIGWERRRGQTAYEYSRDLGDHIPDRRAEVEALTEAFVRARYSPRDIAEEDARRARSPWERIRDALQTRRRTHQIASWFNFGKK